MVQTLAGDFPSSIAEIRSRTTNQFALAAFFKPLEPKTPDLPFTLAPLLIQEVTTNKAESLPDQFGAIAFSNRLSVVDCSRPTLYFETGNFRRETNSFLQFAYSWFYPIKSTLPTGSALPVQGVRITLNSSGLPAIWEILTDDAGFEQLYVAQSLEEAARAEFGKPLPGRRYSIERALEETPNVVVPRVIDDSPVAMGPIIYLHARTRCVSTVLCRCMPAQAKKLSVTRAYDLQPLQSASPISPWVNARRKMGLRTAFWAGDSSGQARLEQCLRLPKKF